MIRMVANSRKMINQTIVILGPVDITGQCTAAVLPLFSIWALRISGPPFSWLTGGLWAGSITSVKLVIHLWNQMHFLAGYWRLGNHMRLDLRRKDHSFLNACISNQTGVWRILDLWFRNRFPFKHHCLQHVLSKLRVFKTLNEGKLRWNY